MQLRGLTCRTRGKPSHAGWALQGWRVGDCREAKHVAVIEAMTSEGDCTFLAGVFNAV